MVPTRRATFAASHPNGIPSLLSLPMELRVMIIDSVFAQSATIIRGDSTRLDGARRHWVPPPILRTCRQLRFDGLPAFREKAVHFDMLNFDVKDLLAYYAWLTMVRKAYPKNARFSKKKTNTFIKLRTTANDAAAQRNLWLWIEAYFQGDAPGYFVDKTDKDRTKQTFNPVICRTAEVSRVRFKR